MYWLRWRYHVKDIAGAPYKIKQNKKQKGQKHQQSVVAGKQQLHYTQYNHDRLVIVKRRPEKYSLQFATKLVTMIYVGLQHKMTSMKHKFTQSL